MLNCLQIKKSHKFQLVWNYFGSIQSALRQMLKGMTGLLKENQNNIETYSAVNWWDKLEFVDKV